MKRGAQPGSKNNNWGGDDVGYHGIHGWLKSTFGKASVCEADPCTQKSKKFEWALIKGKKYERKRENFKMLCVGCHKKYDITIATKAKIAATLTGRSSPRRGIKYTDKQKAEMDTSGLIMFKKGYIPWNKGITYKNRRTLQKP